MQNQEYGRSGPPHRGLYRKSLGSTLTRPPGQQDFIVCACVQWIITAGRTLHIQSLTLLQSHSALLTRFA